MTDELKKALEAQGEAGVRKLRARINIASNASMLVNRFGLSEEEFCSNLDIPTESYHEFMSGTYNYTADDASMLDYYTEQLNVQSMRKKG